MSLSCLSICVDLLFKYTNKLNRIAASSIRLSFLQWRVEQINPNPL